MEQRDYYLKELEKIQVILNFLFSKDAPNQSEENEKLKSENNTILPLDTPEVDYLYALPERQLEYLLELELDRIEKRPLELLLPSETKKIKFLYHIYTSNTKVYNINLENQYQHIILNKFQNT
jgi:hypothetical protein